MGQFIPTLFLFPIMQNLELKRDGKLKYIFLSETVPKKTENSIMKNQRKSKSLIFTGSKIFTGQ
jgi:hypothetical protein